MLGAEIECDRLEPMIEVQARQQLALVAELLPARDQSPERPVSGAAEWIVDV
jgi:hypothetical protein